MFSSQLRFAQALKAPTLPISGSYASLNSTDLYYPITLAAQLFDESITPLLPGAQGGPRGGGGVCPTDLVLSVDSTILKLPTGLSSSNCPPSPALTAQDVMLNKYELKEMDSEEVYTAQIPSNLLQCTNDTLRPFNSMRVTSLKAHIGSQLRDTFRQLLIPDFVLYKALGMDENDIDLKDEKDQVLEMWNSTYINHIISGIELAMEDLEDFYVLVLNREDKPGPTTDDANNNNTTANNDTVVTDPLLGLEPAPNTTIDDSTEPFGVVRQLNTFTPTDAISVSGCSYIFEIKDEDETDASENVGGSDAKEKENNGDSNSNSGTDKDADGAGIAAVTVNDDVSAKTLIEILVPLLLPLFGHSRWSNMPIPSLSLYPTESRCTKSTNSTHSNHENSGIHSVVMEHQPAALKEIVQVKDFDSWFTISVNGNACSSAKFNSLLETEYFKSTSLHGENKYSAETFAIANDVIQFLEDRRTAVSENENNENNNNNKSQLSRLYPLLSQKLLDTLAKASIFVGRVDLGQCFNLINRRTLQIILFRRSSHFLRCNHPSFPRLALDQHVCEQLQSNPTEYSAFFIQPHAQHDCIFSSNSATADIIRQGDLLSATMEADLLPSDEPSQQKAHVTDVSDVTVSAAQQQIVGPSVPPML